MSQAFGSCFQRSGNPNKCKQPNNQQSKPTNVLNSHNNNQNNILIDSNSDNDSDNDDINSNDSDNNDNEADVRIWPPTAQVTALLDTLPDNDPNKIAWQTLIDHNKWNSKADPDWYPFRNELHFLLFLARFDPNLGITRQIIQIFLDILQTLQKNGHITDTYNIPKHATTVEKWWQFIPKPPIS